MNRDDRLEEARAMSMLEVADRLAIGKLRIAGDERVGPCPLCGGDDRFSISLSKKIFRCRKCNPSGGDQVELVRHVMGLDFKAALAWLCGEAVDIDPRELERRRFERERREAKDAARAERKRQEAIAQALEIWRRSVPGLRTPVQDYLRIRGIDLAALGRWPASLRYIPDLPYMVWRSDRRAWESVHVGPAMIAAMVNADGDVCGVHRTWFDLSADMGKARILNGDQIMPRKKTLGSKKGAIIRLLRGSTGALIMGEGIETTLSVAIADPRDASYWCGVDLGNMGGLSMMKRVRLDGGSKAAQADARHFPDMSDERAFVPPDWVDDLTYLQDGDSDPETTRAILTCGLRRAKARRADLRARIAFAGAGRDFNDILSKGGSND
jgi:hypothetical protein